MSHQVKLVQNANYDWYLTCFKQICLVKLNFE